MEKILYIQKFASGHGTVNGKYTLLNPLWYRGGVTVKITETQALITVFGFRAWGASLTDILSVQIKPEVLGARVNITSRDGKGFLFIVNDLNNLVNILKGLNLPVQYDEKALESEAKRFQFASNPIVLTVTVILAVIFVVFIIYNIIHINH